MYGKLLSYTKYIEKASAHPTRELREFHDEMVHNFQHERLIHLMVTLFFVFLLIVFASATMVLYFVLPTDMGVSGTIVVGSSLFITAVVFITTLMYIRHYYRLENGIEYLYTFTAKLYSSDKVLK